MIAKIRNSLKKNLHPDSFHRICFFWWMAKFYVPRRIASSAIRRPPRILGPASELGDTLKSVNTFCPTPMCTKMTKHSSDKGNSWHNYTTVYHALFHKDGTKVRRVFELGLGRDHPDLSETIGKDGRPGASLRGWREIFPKAEVFGADIDRSILFEEDRIKTFYCDQLDGNAIRSMWSNTDMVQPMDIVVEDGLHTFEGNVYFLRESIQKVKPGGYYAVEDIKSTDLPQWEDALPGLVRTYPDYEFALLQLPNSFNSYDNNMLLARRKAQ